ncbi:PrsW family intramembrane metalloprotease [Streptomyces sp. NBC_01803]|uniref:PrsW family intramembrane metalloprotease n=1 Tax=Streptomyces sp. NBC_01803 TaxID=2975946 RepID=UPI002DD9C475|nr:PrsW family intramembrane metalloprotease [Streptomyces sp. NBC_01803]WSA44938.1 PrsW family intramembrane metalloprotease [Streptomyces sp. NBC_01803]
MRSPFPPRLTARRAIAVSLPLCGLVVAGLVCRETGAEGFWTGLLLALLPVPFLLGALRWVDAQAPKPWRTLAFAFGWGACAATLFALLANGLLVRWLTDEAATIAPRHANTLELTVIAPVVEETSKAVAVLLLFLRRPHAFNGILAGIVTAGVTATGFAFTENILYLGSAFAQDRSAGLVGVDLLGSRTAVTFFVRVVVAPAAHPMFTALTGVGFGLAAVLARHRRAPRALLPLGGLAAAMGLHSAWNASASMDLSGFGAMYGLVMLPAFGLLCWLTVWARQRQLSAVREMLPLYAAAGWLSAAEPPMLGSARRRSLARRLAHKEHGQAGWRAVAGYQAAATSLALLREQAERGAASPDFAARERELLDRVRRHRELAGPPTVAAARL